jgi:ubiquinone/menaquinone biosynthesis C-methylase UbiE
MGIRSTKWALIMSEKEKYVRMYAGDLRDKYVAIDLRGKASGGYGRACWGENIIHYIKETNPGSICDVGCGYGVFCDKVSEFIPIVYGVDIASVITANTINNPKIKFIDGEAKSIPLEDKSVDWVTCFDCLEHCAEGDLDAIFKEFSRVSKKGFILSIAYIPDEPFGVKLHLTVKPQEWWISKIQAYGKVTLIGSIPEVGTPYIIVEKINA